jgi:hypothetical protein
MPSVLALALGIGRGLSWDLLATCASMAEAEFLLQVTPEPSRSRAVGVPAAAALAAQRPDQRMKPRAERLTR